MERCPECNKTLTAEMLQVNMCWECGCVLQEKFEEIEIKEKELAELKAKQLIEQHIVTTSDNVEGYKISSYIDIVSGDVMMLTGIIAELESGFAKKNYILSNKYAKNVSELKKEAKMLMINESIKNGGNAIIGMRFNIVHLTDNILGIFGEGTSVVLEKIDSETE